MSDQGRPLNYLWLFPILRGAAERSGYALALHGSLARDFDLVAIPWTDEAVHPQDLLQAMTTASGLLLLTGPSEPAVKPHGRVGFRLFPPTGGDHYVDLSIMPREAPHA